MSQAAWETAMGMRGYSGSPAERELRYEALTVTVTKQRAGRYLAIRSDGRTFLIFRGSRESIVEAQDTYSVDGAPTLAVAVASLRNRWTRQSKEVP